MKGKQAAAAAAGILLCAAAIGFLFLSPAKPKPVYTARMSTSSDLPSRSDRPTDPDMASRPALSSPSAIGQADMGDAAKTPEARASGTGGAREEPRPKGRAAGFFYWAGKLYFLQKNGRLARGWLRYRGKSYYFSPKTGASVTGWVFDGGKWYYLEKHAKFTGWHEIGEDRYCFDENGVLYENCVTPDGYYVDEDGKWIDTEGEGRSSFTWNKSTASLGPLSGLVVAGHPAELYMLCIAGETSGFANAASGIMGDRGRAYGICQYDYRYDLVDFMRYAYRRHPALWNGFSACLDLENGDPELVSNEGIAKTFLNALRLDYETAVSDQLEYITRQCWDGTESAMNAAGFMLGRRHIAVSSALFSLNVNCGPHTSLYLQELQPGMTDEEMIRALYRLRNTAMAEEKVGNSIKGTSTRYLSAEPQMALDLLYGYTTIDSHVVYGGGVEWHGNPFSSSISTIPNIGSISFATPSNAGREPEAGGTAGDTQAGDVPAGQAGGSAETAPAEKTGETAPVEKTNGTAEMIPAEQADGAESGAVGREEDSGGAAAEALGGAEDLAALDGGAGLSEESGNAMDGAAESGGTGNAEAPADRASEGTAADSNSDGGERAEEEPAA